MGQDFVVNKCERGEEGGVTTQDGNTQTDFRTDYLRMFPKNIPLIHPQHQHPISPIKVSIKVIHLFL
jgi:hypothetical protein